MFCMLDNMGNSYEHTKLWENIENLFEMTAKFKTMFIF